MAPREDKRRGTDPNSGTCQWVSQAEALAEFGTFAGKTQTANHIKPLHWYVACRLVVEGGFNPEHITPRPPFKFKRRRGELELGFDSGSGGRGEQTILGGLKTKNVDVVVTLPGLGPVLAVSCKGVTGAFRNLTNRMEETIGECTNLHITYPALVLGYFALLRANRHTEEVLTALPDESDEPRKVLAANDLAINEGGDPVMTIRRFHNALREMTARHGIRNDLSRYEAVALAMVDMTDPAAGMVLASYPAEDSPLRLDRFFDTLYLRYDERYVYSAPDLQTITRRLEWSPQSPAFNATEGRLNVGYAPRLASDKVESPL